MFTARAIGGTPTPSSESRQVKWVDPQTADGLTMDRSMRTRVQHYLSGQQTPHLG